MINQNKILELLNDHFKCPLVELKGEEYRFMIVVKSAINAVQLKKLIEFCEPLHYSVRFDGIYFKGLIIEPKI